MIDYDENYGISQALHDIELEQYRDDLKIFFLRLFMDMVKTDIKNREAYTIALGITVEENGNINMKYPDKLLSGAMGEEIDLLHTLMRKPKDKKAINRLKEIIKENQKSKMAAVSLLPNIRFEEQLPGMGCYFPGDNTIEINSNGEYCQMTRTALHELTHHRQFLQANALGALHMPGVPVKSKLHRSKRPLLVLNEEEAEQQSLDWYPDKPYLLSILADDINGQELCPNSIYPYFDEFDQYAWILKSVELGNRDHELVQRILEKRKSEKKLAPLLCGASVYPEYNRLVEDKFYKLTKNLASLMFHTNDDAKLEKILRGKALQEIEEEEKNVGKSPFPMKFSKKFENRDKTVSLTIKKA